MDGTVVCRWSVSLSVDWSVKLSVDWSVKLSVDRGQSVSHTVGVLEVSQSSCPGSESVKDSLLQLSVRICPVFSVTVYLSVRKSVDRLCLSVRCTSPVAYQSCRSRQSCRARLLMWFSCVLVFVSGLLHMNVALMS